MRTVRGITPKTCEGLLLAARRILGWHDVHFPRHPLATLSGEQVLALLEHLLRLSVNNQTRASITSGVRMFLRYLQWSGHNDQDLARFVPRIPWHGQMSGARSMGSM